MKDVIGIGSLKNWTRDDVLSEYNSIVKNAEKGNLTCEEWDAMSETLAKLYIGTSCESFSTLVRLFLFGRFQTLRSKDIFKNI